MSYDFDTPLPLANSRSLKWSRYAGRDVIPMWVADMDFAAPPAIIAALSEAVQDGHFVYTKPDKALASSVVRHIDTQYQWQIDPDWIVWLPGLVVGLNLAVRAATAPGDQVFTATPVYPPFLSAPSNCGRLLRTAGLVRGDSAWEWDFAACDPALADSRLWLLCHPHNPVGRAWNDDELAAIAKRVLENDLIVCSDEIHCGLVLDPARVHRPLAAQHPEIAARSITLMAPSKTFNIPGLGAAFAIIPDAGLRTRFRREATGIVPEINQLGLVAMHAAFTGCEPWRQALISQLRRNAVAVQHCVAGLPGLRTTAVEATFLAWIDCREWAARTGVENLYAHFEAAGLGLSDGRDFGAPGFVRLNFGCPAGTLNEGLARLAAAVGAG